MRGVLQRFFRDLSGATGIEYGIIAGLLSIAIFGAVSLVGTRVSAMFNSMPAMFH